MDEAVRMEVEAWDWAAKVARGWGFRMDRFEALRESCLGDYAGAEGKTRAEFMFDCWAKEKDAEQEGRWRAPEATPDA